MQPPPIFGREHEHLSVVSALIHVQAMTGTWALIPEREPSSAERLLENCSPSDIWAKS